MNQTASLPVRPNPTSKGPKPKDKAKKTNRSRVYGVNKNSLSRSLTDIPNPVSESSKAKPRGNSICYVTPKSVTPVQSPCPEITITTDDSTEGQPESLRDKFIRAVKEVQIRVQSAQCIREYAKMKHEKEVLDNVGRSKIVIVNENNEQFPKLHSEPTILSFPFAADGGVDDGQPCQHEKCLEASVTPRNRIGVRLCMLSAICQMKRLASKRPKTIKELKQNPITTAHEKSLREQEVANTTEHVDSDSETEPDPLAHVRGCRYLRGVKEDQELSIDEIFN